MKRIKRPMPRKAIRIWRTPVKKPSTVSSSTMLVGWTPWWTRSIAKAESTAAAGAQGALIRRSVPPKVGAIRPSAMAPRTPASAPKAA